MGVFCGLFTPRGKRVINQTEHYLACVLLMDELDEAKEHLDVLMKLMATNGRMDEAEFATYLGHVYAASESSLARPKSGG
jgi:hypothetical protein